LHVNKNNFYLELRWFSTLKRPLTLPENGVWEVLNLKILLVLLQTLSWSGRFLHLPMYILEIITLNYVNIISMWSCNIYIRTYQRISLMHKKNVFYGVRCTTKLYIPYSVGYRNMVEGSCTCKLSSGKSVVAFFAAVPC
jgi:hypothetical protein